MTLKCIFCGKVEVQAFSVLCEPCTKYADWTIWHMPADEWDRLSRLVGAEDRTRRITGRHMCLGGRAIYLKMHDNGEHPYDSCEACGRATKKIAGVHKCTPYCEVHIEVDGEHKYVRRDESNS